MQTRILGWTADAPNLASSLIPSGFNVGIALAAFIGAMLLNGNNSAMQMLATPPRFFVPARDFLPSLADPPKGDPLRLPWLGAPLIGRLADVHHQRLQVLEVEQQ